MELFISTGALVHFNYIQDLKQSILTSILFHRTAQEAISFLIIGLPRHNATWDL